MQQAGIHIYNNTVTTLTLSASADLPTSKAGCTASLLALCSGFLLRHSLHRTSCTASSIPQREIAPSTQVRNVLKIVAVNGLETLIGLIASHECIVCGLEGDLLCESCLNSELTEPTSKCYRCYKASPNQAVCQTCRKSVSIHHVWTVTNYGEIPKKLVHKLKFERAIAAAMPIAKKIDQSMPVLSQDTIICHIPTASKRIRTRGYDQAEEIAKALAKIRKLPHKSLLTRTGKSRQVGSGRADRFKHLRNAFKVKNYNLNKTEILLIDDVTTTGATIEAAAKALKKAGAKTINVAVFAQPAG